MVAGALLNGLVFVAQDNFEYPFSITLVDAETGQKFVLPSYENQVIIKSKSESRAT
jgi:hypothetical protein